MSFLVSIAWTGADGLRTGTSFASLAEAEIAGAVARGFAEARRRHGTDPLALVLNDVRGAVVARVRPKSAAAAAHDTRLRSVTPAPEAIGVLSSPNSPAVALNEPDGGAFSEAAR